MRFVFAEDSDAECHERARVLAAMDAFWCRVGDADDELSEAPSAAVEARLMHWLAEVDPRLCASVFDGSARTLVFTPRGHRQLRPMVAALLQRAPRFSRLRLSAYSPAVTLEAAIESVLVETGLDLRGARARAGFGRGHLLELSIHHGSFSGAQDERALLAADILAERLLGERTLDHWIGSVRVVPQPKGGPLRVLNDTGDGPLLALEELAGSIGAAVDGCIAGLPERPWCELSRSEGWTMFEAEPELSSDYADQDDVALATTVAPEMLKCFLEGAPFSSLRFSKHGEVFCYLKVESLGDSEARVRERTELEEALNDALPHDVGRVIGNGLGIRYAYIDLALRNLEAGVGCIRDVARARRLSPRSWLLFCDADYGAEWIGLAEGSPPPPQR